MVLCSTQIIIIHAGFHSVLAVLGRGTCSTSYVIDSGHQSGYYPGARAVKNQAKNNVTSRVRLDEKYYYRRAVQKLAKYNAISRVFSEYFSRKRCPARVQLSRR